MSYMPLKVKIINLRMIFIKMKNYKFNKNFKHLKKIIYFINLKFINYTKINKIK